MKYLDESVFKNVNYGQKNSCLYFEATGISALDKRMGFIQQKDLIVVGARPGRGATAMALQMATQMSKVNPIIYFASEQPSRIATRLLKIDSKSLSRVSIHVNEDEYLELSNIKNDALKFKKENGLGAIFLDSYDLIKKEKSYLSWRQRELEKVLGIIDLSDSLNVPVIVCAHISRATEYRLNQKPELEDFDGNYLGAIADKLILIDRPYYEHPLDKLQLIFYDKNKSPNRIDAYWSHQYLRFSEKQDFITKV